MVPLCVDVNDKEICKRLGIIMATNTEDLPLRQVEELIAEPLRFDPKHFPEPFTQYARHFVYMAKRKAKLGDSFSPIFSPDDLTSGTDRGGSRSGGKAPKAKKAKPHPKKKAPNHKKP